MQPTPEPSAKLQAADDQKLIAADLINPSALLMDSTRCVKLLLSRSTIIEPKAIHLHSVRLIEIPLGMKLKLLRFLSHFWKVRLPDEFEFASLDVLTCESPAIVSWPRAVVGTVSDPNSLIQLTGPEYKRLFDVNGRTLLRWVSERFGLKDRTADAERRAA